MKGHAPTKRTIKGARAPGMNKGGMGTTSVARMGREGGGTFKPPGGKMGSMPRPSGQKPIGSG